MADAEFLGASEPINLYQLGSGVREQEVNFQKGTFAVKMEIPYNQTNWQTFEPKTENEKQRMAYLMH